jgi:Cu/Ag efflux protein CusF
MTLSATNSTAAEVLVNHVSAETLNTGRMTLSATNSTAAEVLINHISTETLNTGRMTSSYTIKDGATICNSFLMIINVNLLEQEFPTLPKHMTSP